MEGEVVDPSRFEVRTQIDTKGTRSVHENSMEKIVW